MTQPDFDRVKIFPAAAHLADYVALRIVKIADATLQFNDTFSIALSGGSTPRPVYQQLGTIYADALDWSRVHIWWGDERAVPPDDSQSNYHMAREIWLDHVAIPPENVHRMRGEDDPKTAAAAYENELQQFFGDDQTFDLNLLGMGEDGHTASLFPHTAALNERQQQVIAHHVTTKGDLWRITLTVPAILRSSNILFMVAGAGKADVLYEVLEGQANPAQYPSQLIVRSDHEHIVLAVDQAAASRLTT